jgi:hypothetical protein
MKCAPRPLKKNHFVALPPSTPIIFQEILMLVKGYLEKLIEFSIGTFDLTQKPNDIYFNFFKILKIGFPFVRLCKVNPWWA